MLDPLEPLPHRTGQREDFLKGKPRSAVFGLLFIVVGQIMWLNALGLASVIIDPAY